MAGLLNTHPYGGGLLGSQQSSGLLGGIANFFRPWTPEDRARVAAVMPPDLAPTQIVKGMVGGAANLAMQANEAMPWGGNNPQAIGYDPAAGTIDPSVMIPFAQNVAGMATTGAMAAPPVAGAAGMGIRTVGGGMTDPTITGWTFKDVAHPHQKMGRGDWRRVTHAVEAGDFMEVELPIRSLNATQNTVNPDFAAPKSQNSAAPFVIKKGGEYYVQDGHHRLVKAAESGQQTAKVRLVDLDGTTQTDFPLVDAMASAPSYSTGGRF